MYETDRPSPRTNLYWVIAALALLVSLALAGSYYQAPQQATPITLAESVDPGCQLESSESCSARLADGDELQIAISPRPIPLLKPLQVTVIAPSVRSDRINIEFRSLTMEMGTSRFALNNEGDNTFRGEAQLPFCSSSKMEWLAVVEFQVGDKLVNIPFNFSTKNN